MEHPTENELYNYVFDQSPPADLPQLTTCATCRQTVGKLTRLAKVLQRAQGSQPSLAQHERCVKLFAQRSSADHG